MPYKKQDQTLNFSSRDRINQRCHKNYNDCTGTTKNSFERKGNLVRDLRRFTMLML